VIDWRRASLLNELNTMALESSGKVLQFLLDMLDQAAAVPPPKMAGLDGRKGLARRMTLCIIDDITRLEDGVEGADWSPQDISRLKDKAQLALQAMNDAL
jgi:hypothetical protein